MSRTPIDEARVWMGKLPREDFDKLLLLTNEAHHRGAREAITEIDTRVQSLSRRARSPALLNYLEEIVKEYPR